MEKDVCKLDMCAEISVAAHTIVFMNAIQDVTLC